jgi:hypothetical protein
MPRCAFLLLLLVSLAATAEDRVAACKARADAPKCAREAALAHPAKKAAFWSTALARPLTERIGAGPPELVEFLALDNVVHGYPNQPRASRLAPQFLADVRRAFAELPESVKRPLARKLAGIYFVDDIGGTGFTDEALDEAGKPAVGFVILDPSVLMERAANAWASWKESSPFRPDPAWRLAARIEDRARDDRTHAIQYILLHELGHVLSIGTRVHPSWTLPLGKVGDPAGYPFFALSWAVEGEAYASRFDADFPRRKDVRFYFGAKLDSAAMVEVYEALERTNFPTLYAATHPADDFAESFANYVHTVLMRRPFEIVIAKDGRVAKRYGACWRSPRCAAKREFLERFLAGS